MVEWLGTCIQIRVISILPWLAQLHLFRSSLYTIHNYFMIHIILWSMCIIFKVCPELCRVHVSLIFTLHKYEVWKSA